MFSPASTGSQDGFTLLEMLIVVFILGLLTAMVAPTAGMLNDHKRAELTRDTMEQIRRAVLGPADRFDAKGHPVIGGYVGDMHAWPGLWEARAELRPNFGGVGWEDPDNMTPGLGQGPDYTVDADKVFFRPSGYFRGNRWHWNRPYRRLSDDTTADSDHIGGLETENEGQPRGLWTRFPEGLPFDIGSYKAPDLDLGPNWKGPYISPPLDHKLSDSDHWAENDGDYEALEPVWIPALSAERWEDGVYYPSPDEPGEFFDNKESFRLLQNDGRFVDGWGRALRFFITDDPDVSGDATIFWILSEGPDREGEYPNKGTCASHVWTPDASDTMSLAYDEDADTNQDNIVLKLYSRDWQALLDVQQQAKIAATRQLLGRIRQALVGDAPGGLNSGFTGDTGTWPALFQWETGETDHWDDNNDDGKPYRVGQPRGLWTREPNGSDGTDDSDDLPASQWGIGWKRAYLPAPDGVGEANVLHDAWGRELLFFYDETNDALLVLSRGPDGRYIFGDTGESFEEPANLVEEFDVVNGYDANATVNENNATYNYNKDNVVMRVDAIDWQPGYFQLPQLIVLNAQEGVTKAAFFRAAAASLVADFDLLTAGTTGTFPEDTTVGVWVVGDADNDADQAFNYDDSSSKLLPSGGRYLVVWHDTDNDNEVDLGEDSGEQYQAIIYPVTAITGSGVQKTLTLNMFYSAP
ncbi:type II secretion system protein [uncultured Desulfuromonas sp.]|uniref:type II secretion system protein n=1 Tax=uncultured Desulfuromonas sp. TaxID=181013 RepID=UPI002AABBE0D|nr:type II secretion system protein [uncultured Desulfuromonas sp.]